MRINIPVLVAAAFVLAACSSTGDNSSGTGSIGSPGASSPDTQIATAPAGPKPGLSA